MIRVCKICGDEFETKTNRKICYKDHYRTCVVCNNQFLLTPDNITYNTQTCSTSCARKLVSRNISIECTCKICGKTFQSSRASSKICPDHTTLICENCNQEFAATHDEILRGKKTCSDKCRYELAQRSYQQKYGKDNHEGHLSMLSKYSATMQSRYGVNNSMHKKEFIDKSKKTKKERYGENYEKITDKIQSTTEGRYGTKFLMQVPEFKEKSKQTCIEKYGSDNYAKSSQFLKKVISEPDKSDMCKSFRDDPRQFILDNFPDSKPTLRQLSERCGIRESSIGWIIDKGNYSDLVSYTYSKMEDEVYEFLESLHLDAHIVRNTFKIISPYELDLYIPKYKFAIECNPTITHNSTVPGFGPSDKPKSSNYHKMKTDMCEEKGIFLFHIFGYDWSNKKDVIKSMIMSALNCTPSKIYARNTDVREVSDNDAVQFLNTNHRQGGSHSKVRLGLYYQDRLVSLMTFSKIRKTIGSGNYDDSGCYELVRFCNELNCTVVGGASKLFKYFVDNYNPCEVRSFSDRAHTRGNLYSVLGFNYDHMTDPGYMWVDLKSDRAFARSNAQKKNIISFLKDDTIDLNNTEVQIMKDHNFVQVFDSGVILWIWRR